MVHHSTVIMTLMVMVMRDSVYSTTDSVYDHWTLPGATVSQYLKQYTNIPSFVSTTNSSFQQTLRLRIRFTWKDVRRNHHVVYNGSLIYHEAGRPNIISSRSNHCRVITTVEIPNAIYRGPVKQLWFKKIKHRIQTYLYERSVICHHIHIWIWQQWTRYLGHLSSHK